MIERDIHGNTCGVLKVEGEKNGSKNAFTEARFFLLDLRDNKLKIYFDRPENLPKTSNQPIKEIKIDYISKVSDATKIKYKPSNCFCITNSGEQYYVQADSKDEMDKWIQVLNDASKIQVPQGESKPLAPARSRNEVAGGVVIQVPEVLDNGLDSPEVTLPALSLPSICSGYATKQGYLRKNWKKRFFVLDEKGFSYYKNDQDKKPIRTIPMSEINEVKKANRQHHPHRDFLFEVITTDRIFNIQCESEKECDRWVDVLQRKIPISAVGLMSRSSPSFGKHSSSQEEIKPSKAVWEDNSLPADRRSKTSLREYKKGWSLW